MNIFFLDPDPTIAARQQVSKSAVKMILESAQMLSDAVRHYGYSGADVYKGAYHNHPSTVWARRSQQNYLWLCEHALELCLIYNEQFGKTHKSQAIIERCIELADIVPSSVFSWRYSDLAMKSTQAGIAAIRKYQLSDQSFQSFCNAYKEFYNAKDYVIEARAKSV